MEVMQVPGYLHVCDVFLLFVTRDGNMRYL
jgi:hypothetical protein